MDDNSRIAELEAKLEIAEAKLATRTRIHADRLAAADKLAEAAGIAVAAWEHPGITDDDVNTLMWDLKQALTAYTQTRKEQDDGPSTNGT